jgi:predicted RNase H-like nuclease (RuvC/YqgF family)
MTETKKQFPFRYSEETEALFEQGFKLYKSENQTPKFSLNQLIELCLRKAIVFYPELVKKLKSEITQLNRQLLEAQRQKEQMAVELNALKDKVRLKFQVDNELSKMVNLK